MTKRATIVAALSVAALSASADLPDAYRRLTYVEATGSQWVLTDYVPKGNSCITAEIAFSDFSDHQTVFCARGSDPNVNSTTLFWIKDKGLRWDYGASKATGPAPVHYESVAVNTPLTINCRMNEFWLNSKKSTISKVAAQDYTADNNLVLFAAYSQAKGTDLSTLQPDDFTFRARMKLYSFAVTEGLEVKLDLIPCQRKADSKIGLYDLVSGKFLEPVGGELQGSSADLPNAYRRLTYVEATGAQWVLTHCKPTGNACITAGMSFSDFSDNQAVFCARGSDPNVNSTTLFWIKDKGLRWDYGASKATGPAPVHYEPVDVNTPLTINCRMNEFWLNSEKSTISKEAAQDYTADNNLVLFASHSQAKGTDLSKLSSSAFSAYAKMRLYSLTASEGSEVKLDLIPCQRKADSKIGLYDLVKGLFLEPVGGDLQGGDGMALLPADDFKPVNLPSEFSQLSYVQATGSQWVVTGCVPTGNADIDAEVSFASLKEMQTLLCARGSESTINSTTLFWIFGVVHFGAAEVGFRWDYGATGAIDLVPNSRCDEGSVKENTRIKIASRKNEFYIDDRMSWISKASPSDYTADNPLVLFASYSQPKGTKLEDLGDAAFTAKANVWLYSFKVSDGASAVMDLIPCRRTQDGKVGLYDTVGGTFLEPRGGELIAGPEAVEPATSLRIESDGGAPASMPRLGKYAVLGETGQVVVTASPAEVENSIITPISWKLTVTDSEGVVQELRSDVSNGQRCVYSPKTGDHAVLTWHCVKTAKVAKDGLPPGYSSLPYVEATGTQCIVTDFTPKGSSCVDADFALMSTTEAQWIFCARGTGSVDSFGLCYVNNSGKYSGVKVEWRGFRWDYRDVDANRLSREFGIQPGKIVACRSDRNELYLNSYLSTASGPEPLEFVAGNRLVLFAGYAVSAPAEPTDFSSYAKLRLYSFVVREEGVTKLSLVPCVRNSDSVVGLYDTVAGKFHEPQGGALVAGRMGEDELEVTGVKAEYGAPSLPYGITTGLAAGDSFVCSAPKKVEKADGGWISCLCYDLQSNDVNRVSYPWKKGAGNSFVYEHQADAGARLVWRWGTPGLMLLLK